MTDSPQDIRLTDAEWIVMDALWRLARGTAREVLDTVGEDRVGEDRVGEDRGWAYTTVKTMLDRLTDKGVLIAGRGGPATIYHPRVERGEAQAAAVRQLRARAFGDDARSLARAVLEDDAMTASDRRELARELETADLETADLTPAATTPPAREP